MVNRVAAELDVDQEKHVLLDGALDSGGTRFSRKSPSWDSNGLLVAERDSIHCEQVDGANCLFIGRRTRNLLPAEFAPFSGIPAGWSSHGQVSLQIESDNRQNAISIDAQTSSPVILEFPEIPVDPNDETSIPSTGFLRVLYQLSLFAWGSGRISLKLENRERPEEVEERIFELTDCRHRFCIALDGHFKHRVLKASITLDAGSSAWIDGCMLEPLVTTYRSVDRAKLVPNPGSWTPGGCSRDRDRFSIPMEKGAIPASGMIDFWFRPTWHPLHPQHAFFQACHGYFGFEIRAAEPLFFAGKKVCPWMYYWEWGQAESYLPDTWHHYALVWREQGGLTIYLDGQSRAHVEQVPTHAFKPELAGSELVIGSTTDGSMCLDANVPAEMDAYLATWRLSEGQISAADVLAAMGSTDPRGQRDMTPPKNALFLIPEQRFLIDRAKDHCWFVHNLTGDSQHLVTSIARGDDHHHNPYLRQSTSGKPSVMESVDGGRTWHKGSQLPRAENGVLGDGRYLVFDWCVDGDPPFSDMVLVDENGAEESFRAVFDMSSLADWQPGTRLCAHKVIELNDGRYLMFASGSYPGICQSAVSGTSVFVIESHDLHQWKAIACPYRPDGIHDRFNETSAVQFPNGRIVILMRTGGWNMKLAKGISDDGGYTWSPPLASGLRGIQPRMRMLKDGSILVVTGRPGIIMAFSSDNGESFNTITCAEDDRIHEFSAEFGWYGYSCMNNGFAVDESAGKAYISYDLLDERADDDGTLLNACYVRPYNLRKISDYASRITSQMLPGSQNFELVGSWQVIDSRLMVTNDTGASVAGSFNGSALIAILETSPHNGTALVEIDARPVVAICLFLPYRKVQRVLLAADLPDGQHTFKISLKNGWDEEHKFANPEMPMLGGMQTVNMSGITPERRLTVFGFEAI